MKLQEYLEQNGISPSAFAMRAGVAPSTILRLLNGERSGPRLPLLIKIMAATDGMVTPNDFLSEGKPNETAA